MIARTVAVALVGISERQRGVIARLLERSATRYLGIRYIPLDGGGKSDALAILLGVGLKAPDPSRWGPAVAVMMPLADLIDSVPVSSQEQHHATLLPDLIQALDDACQRYFDGLPAQAVTTNTSATDAAAAAPAITTKPARRRHSVLLVSEDRGRDAPFFEHMVEDEAEFALVASPDEALRVTALDRFDLAILDVDNLAGQAYRLCSELTQRRSGGRMPVLMMGQSRGVLEQWRGRFAGCDGFIPGPEAPVAFRAGVARVLRVD